jgi:FHS family L-fucose permease-like MFS transporter
MPAARIFATADGKNHFVTFALVSSLFLLWGFCNGMIDVMDKHFQEELGLTLAQSAWVQFAHYLGYFLMALPAGWIATKLGYRGGIIAGLLMVAVGGLWFVPATQIAQFWAFLLGVCLIAAGLTFLETVANPYTTVLGAPEYAATRINLAQSCNGIGWILGPMAGAMFFYSTDASGKSTGSETLWIPYAAVAVVVVLLALVFAKAPMPDLIAAESPAPQDDEPSSSPQSHAGRASRLLLWLNLAVLGVSIGMIASAIAVVFSQDLFLPVLLGASALFLVLVAPWLVRSAKDMGLGSIWAHPHFSGATLAQFAYVAAQSGIFAYFINYMTSQPPVPVSNAMASTLASLGFSCFLAGRFIGAGVVKKFAPHKVLGTYALINVALCLLVMAKTGWASVAGVFVIYFFMSIMFPTIFALGVAGLGAKTKKAASYIVMAIMGGAIMPKLMGHVADSSNVSLSFVVPLVCFVVVAIYGFAWSNLSGVTALRGGAERS